MGTPQTLYYCGLYRGLAVYLATYTIIIIAQYYIPTYLGTHHFGFAFFFRILAHVIRRA